VKKSEIKVGKLYESAGTVIECLDLGEGRFPLVPKFRTIYPLRGQERYVTPREIQRQLSDREAEAFKAKG
jgi:hypothetical protein